MSLPRSLMLLSLSSLLAACTQAEATFPPAPQRSTVASPVKTQPLITVHKSQYCGCCEGWIDHVEKAGFTVTVHNREDLDAVKASFGIPAPLASCHTAEVGGYVIEGHVPIEDIQRLLAERPNVRGLTAPGMPRGSPGMEMPDGTRDAYSVLAIQHDGSTSEFARH